MADETDGYSVVVVSCFTGNQYEGTVTGNELAEIAAQIRTDDLEREQELIEESLQHQQTLEAPDDE